MIAGVWEAFGLLATVALVALAVVGGVIALGPVFL